MDVGWMFLTVKTAAVRVYFFQFTIPKLHACRLGIGIWRVGYSQTPKDFQVVSRLWQIMSMLGAVLCACHQWPSVSFWPFRSECNILRWNPWLRKINSEAIWLWSGVFFCMLANNSATITVTRLFHLIETIYCTISSSLMTWSGHEYLDEEKTMCICRAAGYTEEQQKHDLCILCCQGAQIGYLRRHWNQNLWRLSWNGGQSGARCADLCRLEDRLSQGSALKI